MGLFSLFGKKEDKNATVPSSETEKWITATYAIWSKYVGGDWHYFAGAREKSKKEGASMRVMLRRDWGIPSKKELLETVKELTFLFDTGLANTDEDDDEGGEDFRASGAWDICRACQILAMGYVGGYLEREEMVKKSVAIGRIMQDNYSSWTDLYDNYMKGYRRWREELGGDVKKAIAEREALYNSILKEVDGPCSLDWNLRLSE